MNLAKRTIKNKHLVLALAPKRWPSDLPPPVFASDTQAKAVAVSWLRGWPTRDGNPVYASDLTIEQAREVAERARRG